MGRTQPKINLTALQAAEQGNAVEAPLNLASLVPDAARPRSVRRGRRHVHHVFEHLWPPFPRVKRLAHDGDAVRGDGTLLLHAAVRGSPSSASSERAQPHAPAAPSHGNCLQGRTKGCALMCRPPARWFGCGEAPHLARQAGGERSAEGATDAVVILQSEFLD